jgi:thiol-disulfide isomerase/thioredoxin
MRPSKYGRDAWHAASSGDRYPRLLNISRPSQTVRRVAFRFRAVRASSPGSTQRPRLTPPISTLLANCRRISVDSLLSDGCIWLPNPLPAFIATPLFAVCTGATDRGDRRPGQKGHLMSTSSANLVAPIAGVSILSRRRVVLTGLTGALASMAGHATPSMSAADTPTFRSGRYQFTMIRPQRELPSIRLFRLEGGTVDLASLRGKPVLLNFWASWCAACRMELPILNRQYERAWRGSLHVLAVSEDRGSRSTVDQFVKALQLRSLPIYLDPNGYVATSDSENRRNAPFALYGMPITYLISSSGGIVGYLPGAADWSSPEANDFIEYLRNT